MISVFFTYPLELVRVRMAFHTRSTNNGHMSKPTFLRVASDIYHENPGPRIISQSSAPAVTIPPAITVPSLFTRFPLLKFYRGFTVTLTGMVPYAGTSFLIWGFLRSRILPPSSSTSTGRKSTPVLDLTTGAVSGALSQTVSYPFEVIRRRMQVGGLTHPERWMRWGETVSAIWRNGGWRGFYVGLSIGYLKIVPMTAVSFAVWQWGKGILGV
jgi:solute carrier family 25 (mitochondrial carrier protein), member 16